MSWSRSAFARLLPVMPSSVPSCVIGADQANA